MAALEIEDLGKSYQPNSPTGLHYHIAKLDKVSDGNTSVRNDRADALVWKGSQSPNGFGYYQRNRDIGQVFNVPGTEPITIRSVVMRTSKGENAVMKDAPGAKMYLQLFEVENIAGEKLRINDNQTPPGSRAKHGFDTSLHRCDDFVEGVRYIPIRRAPVGEFPRSIPPTTHHAYRKMSGNVLPEQEGHLRFFRMVLPEDQRWVLQPGKRYAFLLGFEEEGAERGLALAIYSETHFQEAAAFLKDPSGTPWWAVRREGDGTIPPTMTGTPERPSDPELIAKLKRESLFPSDHHEKILPTSTGYPDVNTYHIFQFYLETE